MAREPGISNAFGIGLALAALIFSPFPALAQAYQCRLPDTLAVPPIRSEAPRVLPVTGYTLALSWSPEFCRIREQHAGHARQCSGRSGTFGLIVHGLWPDSGRSWPQWCPARQNPSAEDIRKNICLTPSARLLSHAWAKHGTCMVKRPDTYFRVTRILHRALHMPDLDLLSRRKHITAGDLREQWHIANPGWRSKRIGVKLNARSWLEEIRLCYGRDFMPADCDGSRIGAQDDAALKIWRGL